MMTNLGADMVLEDLIADFEKENLMEINNKIVTVQDLKDHKIKTNTLATEVFLREFYGDEIFESVTEDNVDESAKKIEKINAEELNGSTEFLNICKEIENEEFDSVVDSVLHGGLR